MPPTITHKMISAPRRCAWLVSAPLQIGFLSLVVILKKSVPGLSAAALAKFLARAERAVGMRGVVNVLVTTNRDLQTLNSRFRGKDRPTDVLSFAPMPGVVPNLAGDIAISAEIATQSARQLGHPAAQEIKIL